MGVDIRPLVFHTTKGPVELIMWDCAGQTDYAGLGDGYWSESDAAILMFDVTSLVTYLQIPALHRALDKRIPNLPIVLCGNKVDCTDRQVKPAMITYHRKTNLQYYDISARSCYNFEKPFLYLLRRLMNDPELALVETPTESSSASDIKAESHLSSEDEAQRQPLKFALENASRAGTERAHYEVLLARKDVALASLKLRLVEQQMEINALKAAK
jgi:GTP-binding nuclear protein Ran